MRSWKEIFTIDNKERFTELALDIYRFQKENNPVYKAYTDLLGGTAPRTIEEVPFLPIEFFKSHQVYCSGNKPELHFRSSGTGGERSSHYVATAEVYNESFNRAYHSFVGNPKEQVILALLPNYVEQGESSLVYMVDHLIAKTSNSLSGFVLGNPETVRKRYENALKGGKKCIVIGVSYALIDLAESGIKLNEATVIETGGMKGRRKEITKKELHEIILDGLKPAELMSEYGMTELLSQAYCREDMVFYTPPWMDVLIRDVNDPFSLLPDGKTGGINIIDLANLYSCPFIATQDLGKKHDHGFEIMGRFDQSDVRGCNLLVP